MNYLISKFDAMIGFSELKRINKGAIYDISSASPFCVYKEGQVPFLFDFNKTDNNILKVDVGFDSCYILFPHINTKCSTFLIKFSNKDVLISVSDELIISYNEKIYRAKLESIIEYSHYEIDSNVCIIYFEGERRYVAILSLDGFRSGYYDEFNENGSEKYFMGKLFDSLNHGKVFHINNGKVEEYIVYLDDESLCLKDDFLACVFLDCIKCGNFKYANELLCEGNKQKDEDKLKNFFEDFDDYEVFKDYFILTKKNTLSGIYKFEIINHKIENIISQL